ncbi:MAG: hypothetical protein R2705_04325 [Ilumatobacteraceae bacterium]
MDAHPGPVPRWAHRTIAFGSIAAAIVLNSGESAGALGLGGDLSAGKRFTVALITLVPSFLYEAFMTKQFGGTPMKLRSG